MAHAWTLSKVPEASCAPVEMTNVLLDKSHQSNKNHVHPQLSIRAKKIITERNSGNTSHTICEPISGDSIALKSNKEKAIWDLKVKMKAEEEKPAMSFNK